MQSHNPTIELVRARCEGLLPHQYDQKYLDEAHVRLNFELNLIEQHKHTEVFLLAADIGRFATKQDIACKLIGAGPCSLISFLLQLSDIDPLRHQLPAERFLTNPAIGFQFIVDPKHEAEVRGIAKSQTHPATELEMIPHHVARLIRRNGHPVFDLRRLPLEDDRTGEFLGNGNLTGVFQPGSDEVQFGLQKLKPRNLESLTAILTTVQISVSRDGILEEFYERATSEQAAFSKWSIDAELLGETHGLLLYQEQIMLALHRLGGFSLEDGYAFVKQAAKRKDVGEFRERFLATVNSTRSKDSREELFDELERSARYALCKSHQLAACLTTWQSAYLKTHFRREFDQVVERHAVKSF